MFSITLIIFTLLPHFGSTAKRSLAGELVEIITRDTGGTMLAAGLGEWVKAKDPGFVAIKRASAPLGLLWLLALRFTSVFTCLMTRRWQLSHLLVASPLVHCHR
jgi:hypothetical protein